MYEKEDLVSGFMEDNSKRRKRQKTLDIRVIMANPPYSIGQASENDNNDNVVYPHLDARIRSTYAERSNATLSKGLYDSYVRAIRWASDRVGKSGVIGFVTNAGFLDAKATDGLRRCLADEFSTIYVFHLRGLRGQKTAGERARQEGGQIFGAASGTAICIVILVRNPNVEQHGRIYFHDIGDYLSREDKLEKISGFGSIAGIADAQGWQVIHPDEHGDWLRQRDSAFSEFMSMGGKKSDAATMFTNFSLGVVTNRDAWCYGAGKSKVSANMARMIVFYNSEVKRFSKAYPDLTRGSARRRWRALSSPTPRTSAGPVL